MVIRKIDLKSERDRIARHLHDQLLANIAAAGYEIKVSGIPSPRAVAAMDVESVEVNPSDAVLILELFDLLDQVHAKALEADDAYMREHRRISAAERVYRDQRVKGSKAKAAAAVRALGLTARDPEYWPDLYLDYVRMVTAEYGKNEALQTIADRESRTFAAVHQGLKREVSRRKSKGAAVPVALPRV